MPLVLIRTLCQRLIATPCSVRVFLVSKCLRCGHLSSELFMFPKRSTVVPVSTTVVRLRNHHKRRLTHVPVPAGITRPRPTLPQPYSRAFVLKPLPPTIQSSQQNPMVPTKLLEILAEEAIRTIHADGREEESEAVTEHEDSLRDGAPRRGAMSRRRRARFCQNVGHLMSCSFSATSATLLEYRALRTLATRKLYQQTPEHFLAFAAKRKLLIFNDTRMIAAPSTCSNADYMFGVWEHTGGCLHAQISPILQSQEWQYTKITPVFARLESAHSDSCYHRPRR